MLRLNFFKNRPTYFLILLLFLVPSIYSLVLPGFFLTDDGEWMVIRFSAFYQALSDGQFPVRFLGRLNYGYGYPVANFLYPGFMYLATPLALLGLGFVNSIKAILILSMIGGGVFAYFWLSKIFDKTSALVGTIFYTYVPYHLFDLYKRGSVGEVLSLAVVSFALWAIEEKNRFLTTIGIFLLAVSHNSLFLLFVPLLFIYALIRKTLSLKEIIFSFGLGILMSSFFIIPAILELSYTNFSKIEISNFAEYFAGVDLVGNSSIAILAMSSIIVYLNKLKVGKEVYFFLIVSVISIFLSVSLSSFVWSVIPDSLIQFPWRFLSYLVISGAFLTSYSLFVLKNKRAIILPIIIAIIFISSFSYLVPEVKFDKGDSYYATNEGSTNVKDEYLPSWVKEKPTSHFDNKVEFAGGEISNLIYNSKKIYFESTGEEGVVRINTIYYPGWEARINGQKTDIAYTNMNGLIELGIPKGQNLVELTFSETPLRLFSDLISAVAFAILILWNRRSLFTVIRKIK